jgi:hypothetical protein
VHSGSREHRHKEFILRATQRRVQPLIKAVCLKRKELESAVALTDGVAFADDAVDLKAICDADNSDVEDVAGGVLAQYNACRHTTHSEIHNTTTTRNSSLFTTHGCVVRQKWWGLEGGRVDLGSVLCRTHCIVQVLRVTVLLAALQVRLKPMKLLVPRPSPVRQQLCSMIPESRMLQHTGQRCVCGVPHPSLVLVGRLA